MTAGAHLAFDIIAGQVRLDAFLFEAAHEGTGQGQMLFNDEDLHGISTVAAGPRQRQIDLLQNFVPRSASALRLPPRRSAALRAYAALHALVDGSSRVLARSAMQGILGPDWYCEIS
jgi:hypothetical protein